MSDKTCEKIKIDATEKIIVHDDLDTIEQELRELSKEELVYRLKYEEEDPEIIKLIKKIIKDKA